MGLLVEICRTEAKSHSFIDAQIAEMDVRLFSIIATTATAQTSPGTIP